MSYLGKADCHVCDREVDVSESRAGMAYYRCAACGAWMQMKGKRGDRMLREKVRPFEDPDAAPGPAETPPEPAKSSETQPTEKPNNTPRAPRRAGFWSV